MAFYKDSNSHEHLRRPWKNSRNGGSWRGGKNPQFAGHKRPPTPPPFGEVLASISCDELEDEVDNSERNVQITNLEYLTSYNWPDGTGCRIITPGEPPAWTPPKQTVRLQQDSGTYPRDQNASRYPTYPLEPMIRAIASDKPEFCLQDVDILGCANTMGNLLRFLNGERKPFRMLVEVIGETVLFVRRENSPTELLENVYGYGHTFPEAYTTWSPEVRGSKSHQRILHYDFAGMKFVVLYEADGFLPELVPSNVTLSSSSAQDRTAESLEDILPLMQGATVSTSQSNPVEMATKTLALESKGRHIPQCATFDLKTRSIKKESLDVIGEYMPRLWISQIPNFILAYHHRGTFNESDIHVHDIRDRVNQWEESNHSLLAKFGALLAKIVRFVRSLEDRRIEITHEEESDILEFREQGGSVSPALPADIAGQLSDELAGL